MKIGIIGCGLMGARRAAHLTKDDEIVACYDPATEWPKATGEMNMTRVYSIDELLSKSEAVIVATTHDYLVPMALKVVKAGLPCLLEKPCARSKKELSELISIQNNVPIVPGFTLRHYPGIIETYKVLKERQYGKTLYLRAVYGHGGRPGYGNEWRCHPEKSGGGQLMDQGVHLIDLAQYIFGNNIGLDSVCSSERIWSEKVEDSIFLTLKSSAGQISQLHASWIEWRPIFKLEIICEQGGVQVEGLGGAYGNHTATFFTRDKVDRQCSWGDARDASLTNEWLNFLKVIETSKNNTLNEVINILDIIDSAYKILKEPNIKG